MYPPSRFADAGLEAALEVAGLTKFATVVVADGASMLAIHVPLTLVAGGGEGDGPRFVGHIVRTNPLHALLQRGAARAKAIFQPADGYVSPAAYAEKEATGRVVPTWNYVATHFDGVLRLADGEAALRRILACQTADYEGAVGGRWKVSDAPDDYIARMAAAIAGFTFAASDWLTIRKLSQNKDGERARVAAWLEANRPPAASIAYWMRKV